MNNSHRHVLYDFGDAPSARRARMFIKEKGIDVERVSVDLRAGVHLTAEYLAINPAGLVPALKLQTGEVLTENDGIAAYLEAQWPTPPLLGESPIERGRVAQWNACIELEGLLPAAAYLRNSHPAFAGRAVPGPLAFEQIPELVQRSHAQLDFFLPQLNAQLSTNRFVAGERFSFADITAIVFVDLLGLAQWPIPGSFTALAKWSAHVRERPSYGA